MGNYCLQQRRCTYTYAHWGMHRNRTETEQRMHSIYFSIARCMTFHFPPPLCLSCWIRRTKNFTEKLSICIAGSDFQHTHSSSLCLAAVSSSQPVFASLYILWLIEVAGLCSYDKSPHSDSFTAPKEPLDKRQGCKPNILMLCVIVMACVYVCTSEYLGDVKNCLSLPIRKVL